MESIMKTGSLRINISNLIDVNRTFRLEQKDNLSYRYIFGETYGKNWICDELPPEIIDNIVEKTTFELSIKFGLENGIRTLFNPEIHTQKWAKSQSLCIQAFFDKDRVVKKYEKIKKRYDDLKNRLRRIRILAQNRRKFGDWFKLVDQVISKDLLDCQTRLVIFPD